MTHRTWLKITVILIILTMAVVRGEVPRRNGITIPYVNIDEIQNDILFNFHAHRKQEQNIKKKRNALPEYLTHFKSETDNIEKSFYNSILEWSRNNLRSNENAFQGTSSDSRNTERRPVKRGANNPSLSGHITESNEKTLFGGITIPVCDMEQLMTYLAELQAINPESIINLATQQDVDAICYRAINSLDNIDTYLRSCSLPSEKDLYLILIRGVRSLSNKVCLDKKFRSDFLKDAPCFALLHDDYKDCVGPSDWVEDPNPFAICKTYSDIANCYYVKTSAGCGEESVDVMKTLLKYIMDSIVPVDCGDVFSVGRSSTLSPSATSPTLKANTDQLPTEKWKEGSTKEIKRQSVVSKGDEKRTFGPFCFIIVSIFCFNM